MSQDQVVFAFSPGENHLCHLEHVLDSIARYLTLPYQVCVLLPSEACVLESKHPILKKVISQEDLALCQDWYWQEGRTDIPPFAAYAQLFLPKYFEEFPAFLFMEVDQIVRGDLAQLWSKCNRDRMKIAAVRSYTAIGQWWSADSFKKLNPGGSYYNMGVVYLNTSAWLTEGFTDRCIEELEIQKKQEGKRLEFYAQGAMNNALHEEVTNLDLQYNVTGLGYREDIPTDNLENGIILHWSGSRKPWLSNGLYKKYYYSKYTWIHWMKDKINNIIKYK